VNAFHTRRRRSISKVYRKSQREIREVIKENGARRALTIASRAHFGVH
jgi:hypothetical protein